MSKPIERKGDAVEDNVILSEFLNYNWKNSIEALSFGHQLKHNYNIFTIKTKP